MGIQDKPAQETHDIQIDLDNAIQRLTDEERRLLDLLQVKTLAEAARELGKKRTTLIYHVKKIRMSLTSMGLDDAWRS
jgi:DNA-directed RNA polymerase specialized sigma24 family protein